MIISTPDENEQRKMLFPYATERMDNVFKGNCHFGHYSSAKSIYSILSTETMFMFNADHMIDKNEISFGMKMLFDILREHTIQDKFNGILEKAGFKFTIQYIIDIINNEIQIRKKKIYICCLTEHRTTEQQINGRDYMWSEYTGDNGVAIDITNHIIDHGDMRERPFFLFSPVIYVDENDDSLLRKEVNRFIDVWSNVKISHPLNAYDDECLAISYLITVLMISIISIKKKHPYENEQEWRVVLYDDEILSSMLKNPKWFTRNKWLERSKFNGENIFKLHFNELFASDAYNGSSLPFLINRILINSNEDEVKAIKDLAHKYDIEIVDKKCQNNDQISVQLPPCLC